MVTLAQTALNEAIAPDGSPTGMYDRWLEAADRMGREEMRSRWAKAKQLAALDSFTFARENGRNPVPTDWVPRIIPASHWATIAKGVEQRLRALNKFLLDLYGDGQSIVPDDVVYSGRYYRPDLRGVRPPGDVYVHIYGIDLVHLGGGEYAVLEDNLRVPSGISYGMKCLDLGRECMPELREGYSLMPFDIRPAYHRLFKSVSTRETPHAVLLTDGKAGSAFFEHRYLSDLLNVALVEGQDLYVDEADRVWCRTLDGDMPVDVIYRRVEDLEQFVPGLTRAYGKGNVALLNAPGAGAADDKLVFLWVPDMIRAYLGEKPALTQARSYFMQSSAEYKVVMDNLDRMVLKTRDGYGGLGVYILPDLTPELRDAAVRRLKEKPDAFIAQEMLEFSKHLCFDEENGEYEERYIDLRVFAAQDAEGNVTVFPGGLTRVARSGSRVTNNSSGGACKETWVAC